MRKLLNNSVFTVNIIFIVSLLFATIICRLALYFLWPDDVVLWSDNVVAYWFQSLQAVGPIVAIWGAFYVGKTQADAALESVNRAHNLNLSAKKKIFSQL